MFHFQSVLPEIQMIMLCSRIHEIQELIHGSYKRSRIQRTKVPALKCALNILNTTKYFLIISMFFYLQKRSRFFSFLFRVINNHICDILEIITGHRHRIMGKLLAFEALILFCFFMYNLMKILIIMIHLGVLI